MAYLRPHANIAQRENRLVLGVPRLLFYLALISCTQKKSERNLYHKRTAIVKTNFLSDISMKLSWEIFAELY